MIEPALYIVATPIGNLSDLSERAVEILSNVDLIAAEDTRHSRKLLSYLGIKADLITLHDHNERTQCLSLLKKVSDGKSIAVISDAGTPLISDPGYHIVKQAHEQGIRVIPIPGACAVIAALSASGLPTDKFVFEGFLSAKGNARREQLILLKDEHRTMVFYESPHRILDSLDCMKEVFGGERKAVIARELTKTYETIYVGTLSGVKEKIKENPEQQKGEFVVIVAGAVLDKSELTVEAKKLMDILLAELTVKQAVAISVKVTNIRKKILYDYALEYSKIDG